MAKKIFFWSLVIFFIVGVAAGYYFLSNSRKPKHDSLLSLPDSCFLLIEVKNYSEFIKKTTQTNLMWEELKKHNIDFSVMNIIAATDSILKGNNESESFIYENKVSVGLYGKPDSPSYIFDFVLEKGYDEKWINLLNTYGFPVKKEISKKSSLPIYVFEKKENKIKFYACVKEDEVLVSQNIALLEASLLTHRKLGNNKEFMKCREASGNKNDLRLYWNSQSSHLLLNSVIAKNYGNTWTETDIDIRPNELLFNGIISAYTSHFLREITNQKPCEIAFTDYCPQETKSFTFWGFSDFNAFYSNWYKSNKDFKVEKSFTEMAKNVGEELVYLIVEFEKGETSDFIQMKINDREKSEEVMRELSDSVFTMKNEVGADSLYRIIDTTLAKKTTAGLFCKKMKYVFFLDDYLVFGREKNNCIKFCEKVKNKSVLSANENFKRFCSGNISDECNFLRYDYLPLTHAPNYLEEKIKNKINNFPELFQKFHSGGIQLTAAKNQLILQGYLLYSPTTNESRQSVWEAKLDTTLASAPELVVNHKTGLNEIIVQDISGNIYLISNTGNILWKKNINGIKKGKIFQVDYFNNNKLQFLFNTKNEIHLIDRNGKDVEGFPLKLKYTATNSINVFDYDNNKDYRIIYCDSLKNINLLKLNGKIVEGFQSPSTLRIVTQAVEWHRLASKDFLLLTDTSGNLYALNRKGETRIKFSKPIPNNKQNIFVLPGKDISNSGFIFYNTIKKEIQKFNFDQSCSVSPIKTSLTQPNWQLVNFNEENKCFLILTEKNSIEIYDEDGNRVSDIKTETPLNSPLKKLIKNKEIYFAGITDNKKLLVMNANWKTDTSYGIFSSWLPSLETLNDDGFFYWITGHNNIVGCYSF